MAPGLPVLHFLKINSFAGGHLVFVHNTPRTWVYAYLLVFTFEFYENILRSGIPGWFEILFLSFLRTTILLPIAAIPS